MRARFSPGAARDGQRPTGPAIKEKDPGEQIGSEKGDLLTRPVPLPRRAGAAPG